MSRNETILKYLPTFIWHTPFEIMIAVEQLDDTITLNSINVGLINMYRRGLVNRRPVKNPHFLRRMGCRGQLSLYEYIKQEDGDMGRRWNWRRKCGVVLQVEKMIETGMEESSAIETVTIKYGLELPEVKEWVYRHRKFGPLNLRRAQHKPVPKGENYLTPITTI